VLSFGKKISKIMDWLLRVVLADLKKHQQQINIEIRL